MKDRVLFSLAAGIELVLRAICCTRILVEGTKPGSRDVVHDPVHFVNMPVKDRKRAWDTKATSGCVFKFSFPLALRVNGKDSRQDVCLIWTSDMPEGAEGKAGWRMQRPGNRDDDLTWALAMLSSMPKKSKDKLMAECKRIACHEELDLDYFDVAKPTPEETKPVEAPPVKADFNIPG